jgi:hypothetical protein
MNYAFRGSRLVFGVFIAWQNHRLSASSQLAAGAVEVVSLVYWE